jgi:hypothetical protein
VGVLVAVGVGVRVEVAVGVLVRVLVTVGVRVMVGVCVGGESVGVSVGGARVGEADGEAVAVGGPSVAVSVGGPSRVAVALAHTCPGSRHPGEVATGSAPFNPKSSMACARSPGPTGPMGLNGHGL